MEKSIVQLGFGKINFPNTTVSLSCMKVESEFSRKSAVNSGRRIGQTHTYNFGVIEAYGQGFVSEVEHDEGVIILVQSSWKRGMLGLRDGAIFIRLRNAGPKWKITAKLPTDAQNIHGDAFEMFSGRGDLLSIETLNEVGIIPFKNYTDRYMLDEEVDECYSIQLTDKGSPPPILKSISTPEGVKIVEIEPPPVRRIIRRGRN